MSHAKGSSLPATVATIGVFDGVHLGHQALLRRVVDQAGSRRCISVCVTFTPHPDEVLRADNHIAHLSALDDRLQAIRDLGISEVLLLQFTPALSRMSPEEFLDLLLARFQLRELWVGSDFALGRDRSGKLSALAALGRIHGFTVCPFPPIEHRGEIVSSSRIRVLLSRGNVAEANELLGRPYRIRGRVVAGDHRGSSLGFPTANLALSERLCMPGDGVYAVRCMIPGSPRRDGVANIGLRPTFDARERLLEVHLLEFNGDLYGQELAVDFVARLRGERRFASAEELVAQIRQDVVEAREILL